VTVATLRAKYRALAPALTERTRRVWAATEAQALGRGGPGLVAQATGLSPATIRRGMAELAADADAAPLPVERVRKPGGGRKRATVLAPTLLRDLDALVEPTAPGDPESPLRWTCLSTRTLAVALAALGHRVSHTVVAELLHALGYSLQGNVKTREGRQHPDRDAQFRYIARQVQAAQRRRHPAISVDTKKKELVGPFKNGGRAWRPAKTPQRVRVHDFVIPGATGGKAIPYGVYDLHRDEGWVSVGIDHDTATFAARSIRRWWQHMGRPAYAAATTLLITADAGGSNGTRLRLWKWELQQLANRTGLTITVCHFPPGTSKWNKIEHRLFSHIAMNWRGTPLVDLATIVSLIGSTHSRSGLHVRAELDRGRYPAGITVTEAQMATVRLTRHRFHGDWNYTIQPATTPSGKTVVS
jgi:Rhodopirellula transposase DDE domain